MILIDTNVLLRAAQTAHSHRAIALHALKTVRMRGVHTEHCSTDHL